MPAGQDKLRGYKSLVYSFGEWNGKNGILEQLFGALNHHTTILLN